MRTTAATTVLTRGATVGTTVGTIVLALLLPACSWWPSPVPSPSASSPAEPGAPSDETPTGNPAEVTLFFAVNQPTSIRLISETQTLTAASGTVRDVLANLIDGTLQPVDPDYVNLWGHGSALLDVVAAGTLLTLDLHLGALNLGAEAESRAIGQVVWTATELDPTIESVRFLVDGMATESLAGHVDATNPFSREPATDVLNSVQILSPTEGGSVSSPVTATGVACTFEAHVAWTLTSGGQPVAEGTTLAGEACPTRSAWQIPFGALAPANYELTVTEYSAQDGSVAAIDSKRFVVTG
jgi:spore germination protein GerM